MLKVESINVYYGDVQTLWALSFQVKQGEIAVLVGSNGAGKTTVLKTISGLLKPRGGKILFQDQSLEDKKPHEIVAMGIVHIPEGRKLWPQMTVLENLEVGAYIKSARKNLSHSLEKVFTKFPRLYERRFQKVGSMSGGEQQMVAIARGLMAEPRLLMLDEPSLGLAPRLVDEVFNIILQISKEGTTILLVEQNVQYALSVSNNAYVLENGKIIKHGKGSDLLNDKDIKRAYLGA